MLISTANEFNDKKYQTLGIVMQSTVKSRNVFSQVGAGLKSIVGGKIGGFSTMLLDTRKEVLTELENDAKAMGADAIIAVRFEVSELAGTMLQFFVSGTAIKYLE